ncbi:hypothetical protein SBADM41S_08362 [Streptomyces badius]
MNGTQYRAIERPTGGRVDNYLVRGDDLSAECPSLGHGLGVIREHESRRSTRDRQPSGPPTGNRPCRPSGVARRRVAR